MSALGQKQTSQRSNGMSALPPKADIADRDPDVRFVPQADIHWFAALKVCLIQQVRFVLDAIITGQLSE
jgi:hypothetical protein